MPSLDLACGQFEERRNCERNVQQNSPFGLQVELPVGPSYGSKLEHEPGTRLDSRTIRRLMIEDPVKPAVAPSATCSVEQWIGAVHAGDCVELMNEMPVGSVDLVVTSPPYNIKNSTGNGLKNGAGGKWSNAALLDGYDGYDDNMPHDLYIAWQQRCLKAMMRVLREDGAIFYNHKWRVQQGLWQRLADEITSGFPVRQIIIWQRKGGFNHNPGYFLPTYEVVYMIAKPNFKLAEKRGGIGDVWTIKQESDNSHPAPFPVELAQRCIESTNAKIILDPFIGSGTTAIAAEAAEREWIGIDISEDYCRMARERIAATRRQIEGS